MSDKNPTALRVLFAIGQLEVGGTETQLNLLARGLRELGCEVAVIALFRGGPNAGVLRRAGVEVWVPKGRLPRAARVAVVFPRLVWRIWRFRPQVVHAFLFHAYISTGLASRLARRPVYVAGRRSMPHFKEGLRRYLWIE